LRRPNSCRKLYNDVMATPYWMISGRMPTIGGTAKKLDELEFVWDPLETAWEEGFRCLATYREREGHCRVPYGYKKTAFALASGLLYNVIQTP
jgi:hypothetical protein